jgi:hypothetical protein
LRFGPPDDGRMVPMSSSTDSGSRMVFQLHIPGSKICTECILSSIIGQMLAYCPLLSMWHGATVDSRQRWPFL